MDDEDIERFWILNMAAGERERKVMKVRSVKAMR
jgi:hypothetical protein